MKALLDEHSKTCGLTLLLLINCLAGCTWDSLVIHCNAWSVDVLCYCVICKALCSSACVCSLGRHQAAQLQHQRWVGAHRLPQACHQAFGALCRAAELRHQAGGSPGAQHPKLEGHAASAAGALRPLHERGVVLPLPLLGSALGVCRQSVAAGGVTGGLGAVGGGEEPRAQQGQSLAAADARVGSCRQEEMQMCV